MPFKIWFFFKKWIKEQTKSFNYFIFSTFKDPSTHPTVLAVYTIHSNAPRLAGKTCTSRAGMKIDSTQPAFAAVDEKRNKNCADQKTFVEPTSMASSMTWCLISRDDMPQFCFILLLPPRCWKLIVTVWKPASRTYINSRITFACPWAKGFSRAVPPPKKLQQNVFKKFAWQTFPIWNIPEFN